MGKLFVFNLPADVAKKYESAYDSLGLWLNGAPQMELTYDTLTQVFDGDTASWDVTEKSRFKLLTTKGLSGFRLSQIIAAYKKRSS
jgi:hypothetical protein